MILSHRCAVAAMMVVVSVVCMSISVAAATALEIRIKGAEKEGDTRDVYFHDMLALALDHTRDQGAYTLLVGSPANQVRAIEQVKDGQLDLVWTIPTEDREAELLPIRIPLEKGLLGYRVFLIRSGEQGRFSSITSLDDLKTLLAGQGHDWNSTRILEHNGFAVVTASNYDSLFLMLRNGRFDYFPRGLNEAWAELAAKKDLGLTVEQGLLLRYPATSYFFVNKDNAALAARLEKGLRAALADGSFDRLLTEHPSHRELFELAKLSERRVLRIDNPFLPKATPLDEKMLWVIPGLAD